MFLLSWMVKTNLEILTSKMNLFVEQPIQHMWMKIRDESY